MKLLLPVLIFLPLLAFSQNYGFSKLSPEEATRQAAHRYIRQYRPVAQKVQQVYGIPEVIVLAVAGLETNWGRSELARNAKNHFGIKAKSGWNGQTYFKETEEYSHYQGWMKRTDGFRRYASVEQSYEDFGLYLRFRGLYGELLKLPIADYKAWAHQLQRSGYASDQNYANKLLRIIDHYQLRSSGEKKMPDKVSTRQGILLYNSKW